MRPYSAFAFDEEEAPGWRDVLRRAALPVTLLVALLLRPPVAASLVASPVVIPPLLQNAIVIDGIDVPTAVSDAGYGSEIMSRGIKDRMREIFAVARPSRLRLGVEDAGTENKIPEIDVAGGALNIRQIFIAVRDMLGYRDTRISGEIVVAVDAPQAAASSDDEDAPKAYNLIIRSSTHGIIGKLRTKFPDKSFDDLFQEAALLVIEKTNPKLAARYYERTNRFADATRIAQNFVRSTQPDDRIEANLILGTALIRQHRYDEAIDHFQRALAMDQRLERAWTGCALAHLWARRFQQSVRCANEAINLEPSEAASYAFKALALTNLGQPQQALETALQGASRATENRGQPLAAAAGAQLRMRRFDEALALADRAITENPTLHVAHRMRGIALARLSRQDEALASLTRATELDPTSSPNWRSLGEMLMAMGKQADALTAIRKARDTEAGWPDHWRRLADVLVSQRKTAEAMRTLTAAFAKFPADQQIAAMLAELHISSRQLDKAGTVLLPFQDDRNAAIVRALLALARARNNPTETVRFATRLAEIEPRNPAAHHDLYRAQLSAGQRPAATTALRNAIELGHPDRARLQRELERLDRRR